jgi:hypothetical protein
VDFAKLETTERLQVSLVHAQRGALDVGAPAVAGSGEPTIHFAYTNHLLWPPRLKCVDNAEPSGTFARYRCAANL